MRMKDSIMRVFPQVDEMTADDRKKRWRIPGGVVNRLISFTAEELADLLILILGHSLAMKIDLESEFHRKMDRIMQREARRGKLGIRVTEYTDE